MLPLVARFWSPAFVISTERSLVERSAVLDLVSARQGHFLLESGHHGELWLDLESLCLDPVRLQPLVRELVGQLATLDIDFLCGPVVEGAFLALMTAIQMQKQFIYSERHAQPSSDGLFPAGYRVPASLRIAIAGKRVAIVNDVINAGSAVRGTFADLERCGAKVVAIGSLLVLGEAAFQFASSKNVPLYSLAALPNQLWTAQDCPRCREGIPLQDVEGFKSKLHSSSTA